MTTSMTPRWRLILNGKSAGDDDVRDAVTALRDAGVQLDVRVTWEAGDAERYVAEAIADGVDAIVAGGGDGTLSEVATTLAHRDESAEALPALGLLPLGTANDFARAAGIPDWTPHAALRLVLQQPATPIDLLQAGRQRHDPLVRRTWPVAASAPRSPPRPTKA
jgi:diacylglycerol kinase family enzyme